MGKALLLLSYLYMFLVFFISVKYFTSPTKIDTNIHIFYLLITIFIALIIAYTYNPHKKTIKNEYFLNSHNKIMSIKEFDKH